MKGRLVSFALISHRADLSKIQIIDTYKVNDASVYITNDGKYLIVEPLLTKESHDIYQEMMEQLFYSLEPLSKTDDPINYIEKHMWKEAEDRAITDSFSKYFHSLRYYLIRDILGYGILDVLMRDENIEEITAERFDTKIGIIHRKFSEFNILDTNISFGSADSMGSYIQRLMQKTGNTVTAATPIMNAMTKEGDRITVTYGQEVSLPGPTLDIRKFTRDPFTITHLLEFGALTGLMASYFWMLFDAKAFGLVVGETGSGKTTMINGLMGLSNPRWKIVTIEETPELQIPHYRWERLITRTSPMITQSNFDITIMELIKASLRLRPDFEIVGEVRGEEAQFLFQSAATGHGGLTSFHGSSAESALNRLASDPINIKSSQQMLLWFIAHMTKLKTADKKIVRKIVSVKEVMPKTESVSLHELFKYDQKTSSYNIDTIDQLIEKSTKVQDAANILNVEPKEDLQKRIDLLGECQKSSAHSVEQVFSVISKYYANNLG
ncbi:MAG TPA: type II/IV secretion system ATPase subunit [Candidatus Nitrosotenuis sp.]